MKESNLLEEMAKIISEMQSINIWIDDARTNGIARIRYQKSKLRLKELVEAHKPLMRAYEALIKEHHQCTSQ
jgi:predicted HAD superfamily phosphohydrolase YqeG